MSQSAPLRLPPREELVNTFEFEEAAKLKLSAPLFATFTGSDRKGFEKMTFRPRLNVSTVDMDLSIELFGEKHYSPIIVGPVADQRRYHADGEAATARGASAAKAGMILSSRSSVPVDQVAEAAKTPLWYSVYAEAAAQKQIRPAIDAGCKALCISRPPTSSRIDWKIVDQIRSGVTVPILIKGIMTPPEAAAALQHGAQGLVVSNHGIAGKTAPIEALQAIVDSVGDKAKVLVDGSFRRGSDVLKALILGAQGVLLARPVMWGLAAYGADGVQSVIEMLQSDVARSMGMIGAPNLKALNRSMIRIHTR